jgi:hypothetical protein
MKPIEEFTEQDGILINNEQESQDIRELLHGMGLKWCTNASFLYDKPSYMPFVIYPSSGTQSKLEYAKKEQKNLHPASDYIIKAGDEVEVLWGGVFCNNHFYIGKNKKGYFVTEDKDGYIESWKHIRKAPNPKSKAIAEIKKIAEENGINLKEI